MDFHINIKKKTFINPHDKTSIDVLKNINIKIKFKEFVCIVGPSGCGKTTLLRIIAGLEKETNGSIQINNKIVSDYLHTIPTEKRNVGLVVQERALFPHLSIIKNVMFGLNNSKKEEDVLHKGTVRSGERISSNGNLVVIGDVNPGAIISAKKN